MYRCLRTDIDALRGLLQQQDARFRTHPSGKDDFLLISTTELREQLPGARGANLGLREPTSRFLEFCTSVDGPEPRAILAGAGKHEILCTGHRHDARVRV